MLRSVTGTRDTAFCRSLCSFVGFATVVSPAIASLGCEPVDEPSRLEQRAASAEREVVPGAMPAPSTKPADPAKASPAPNPDPASETNPQPPSETEPAPVKPVAPPPSERVTLALALDPSFEYRASVVGMVAFPMNDKPTGYAREETIALSHCTGEGAMRRCTLTHNFSAFEAEPPAGRFLEGDYNRVAHVRSTHPITATGRRATETQLDSLDEARSIDDALTAELSDVHRLFCIRFPDEPVGVGAKWSDTCKTVTAGTVGKRTVAWELSKLEDDTAGGKRAELTYVGQYTQSLVEKGRTVQREGTVSGVLYFFVDDGQPHLMREKLAVPLGRTGVVTQTSINIQFARVSPDAPDVRLRTDGTPFPQRAPGQRTPAPN